MIRWQRNLVLALLAFALAGIGFAYTLARALAVEPVLLPGDKATAPASGEKAADAAAQQNGETLGLSDLMLAVDHDPFRAERERPPEAYRMPGEEEPIQEPPPPPPPPPPFKVVGTIATPDGGVAVIEAQGSTTRVASIGESLFGFTVTAINLSGATVEGNGGRSYSLQIEPPSMNRSVRNAAGRGVRGAQPPQPAPEAMRLQLEDRARILNETLERVRNTPGLMQYLPELQQQLQRGFEGGRGGRAGGRGYEILSDPYGQQRVIIRPARPDTIPGTTRRRER
jgi:hypothetical protein